MTKFSLHPEDATPWYIYKHLGDEEKVFFKRRWSKLKNVTLPEIFRVTVWDDLSEWYEYAYDDYLENLKYVKADDDYDRQRTP